MSLFKTRIFWRTHCEDEEYFDQNCLLITKLNSESDYIVTGSHSGTLRIFKPSCEENGSSNLTDYKPTDLLIEKILDHPILHLNCGKLSSGSSKLQLAILQPRSLSVYALIIKEGATDHEHMTEHYIGCSTSDNEPGGVSDATIKTHPHEITTISRGCVLVAASQMPSGSLSTGGTSGVQNILQLLYEHKLRRLAYNFLVGPFGGTQNRDFVCIQSLDGLLTFFEQESFAFCCFLPDFLLPAPMVFAKKSDSFITATSNWHITSFKYKLLSEAGQNSLENDDSGKKVATDWKFNLGEGVVDIEIVDDLNSRENYIMVLGERNIFCIGDNGKLRYMKRLEFSAICFTNYILNDRIMSLVVSETDNLLIYQNTSLKWSAQLQISPISVKRAFLQNLGGVLVFLSEEGRLECGYLGTEPSLFVAPPLAVQEIDFEKAGLELADLNKIIKNSYKNDIKVTNASAERELTINVSVSSSLERCTFDSKIQAENNKMCSISIEIVPQASFEEVQVSAFVQHPLKVEPEIEFFNNLSEKTSMNCYGFLCESGEIPSLNVQIVASFISNLGVPRSVRKSAMLPLNLAVETCPPVKDSECKVTLNINQSPPGLSVLFPEYGEEGVSSSAIGFKNVTDEGKVVTVLLAKSTERYRLQSDSFASLNLLIEQMVYRLKKYFANKNDFSISFTSPLPINEPLQYIRNHFNTRQKYISLQEQLAQLSSQFRLVQKRLISKFKVKNPTPLSNLELLLEDTFREIMQITENLDREAVNLLKSQNELVCALHVLVNLIKLMDGNNNTSGLIESAFNPFIYDLNGQSWEDLADAAFCYLLRTTLAKSEKDKLRAAHTSFDEVKDVSKVEKHFTQVLERMPKNLETHFEVEEETQEEIPPDKVDETVPIGSKIGESSSRLLSARRGLLRKRHKLDE